MDTDKDRQGGDASSSQEQLAGVRNRIDAIDDRLLELLNERSRSDESRPAKKATFSNPSAKLKSSGGFLPEIPARFRRKP